MMKLTLKEYQTLLRSDFVSFIERSFYELNPQTPLLRAPYIHLIAMHLEACRRGTIKRINPERSCKALSSSKSSRQG